MMEKSNKTQVQGGSGNDYVYKDWSHEPPNESDLSAIKRENELHPDGRRLPVKLNAILSNKAFSGIIEWQPHGRSWRIIDRKRLLTDVLPRFFQNARFNSFIRLVNSWGFRRITLGADANSYYHELFLQGMPHLHIRMRRLLSNEKKAPTKLVNFHAMPQLESLSNKRGKHAEAASPTNPPRWDAGVQNANLKSTNNNATSHRSCNDGHSGIGRGEREPTFAVQENKSEGDPSATNNSAQHQSSLQPIIKTVAASNNNSVVAPQFRESVQNRAPTAKLPETNPNTASSILKALQRLRQAQRERIECLQLQLSEAQKRGNDLERLEKATSSGQITNELMREIQHTLNQDGFFDKKKPHRYR